MVDESDTGHVPATLRDRIVQAAAGLLEEGGLEAVSTRAVAARAGVPPPTIFRTFGDKDGLLEAVGEHGFRMYLDSKLRLTSIEDPVEQLRAAWDLQVRFGLEHPAYFTLVYGQARSGHLPRAGRQAVDELRRMVTRVAASGRLRMSIERAADVMHAVGVGTIITMISVPEESRDLVVFDTTRELVIAALTTAPRAEPDAGKDAEPDARKDEGKDEEAGAVASSAMELRAALGRRAAPALSVTEQSLLVEWLNRLADTVPEQPAPRVRGDESRT